MSDVDWIAGLMRENYNALGFLPFEGIHQYVDAGNYVIQTDEVGRRVGYLLHGPIKWGQPVRVIQHCIQTDRRLHGYGEAAFETLVERCLSGGVSVISLRCAVDLPSLAFWRGQGFREHSIVAGGRHHPWIARLWLPVHDGLFAPAPVAARAAQAQAVKRIQLCGEC